MELMKKFLADQPQSNTRGKNISAKEIIDVSIKNIDNGFSRVEVFFDAPLVSAIEERLKINGIAAPTEHKFLGFAKAGFNRSRSFKMSAHYNPWETFPSGSSRFLRSVSPLCVNMA